MSIYTRKLQVPLPWAILGFGIVLLGVFTSFAVVMTDKELTAHEGPIWAFSVGLVPGLVVALVQFLLSWAEFRQVDKFNKMKIKGVLSSRDEEAYYRKLLEAAETCIDVLGVTASRFANDFADDTAGARPEKKVLIAALERAVHVRILLPERAYLSQDDSSEKFPVAERIFGGLCRRYQNLEVRYFNHQPIASILHVDDDVLVGPVFQNRKSQNTPALHAATGSALAQSYLNYFEDDWNSATPLKV